MASVLLTIGDAVMNALAFNGTHFLFSELTNHGEKECTRHVLVVKKLQRARDWWKKDRIKPLDFNNTSL